MAAIIRVFTDDGPPTPMTPRYDDDTDKPEEKQGMGHKTIGWISSFCLLANNITGPAMVQIPVIYQQAGWLLPTASFILIGAWVGLVGTYLSKAIALLPGNRRFYHRIEFNDLAKAVFPRSLYLLTMAVLLFNFQATNISAIVVSAQTMDNTLLKAFSKTCALVMYPPQASVFECIDTQLGTDSPFGDKYVISIGYLVTLAVTVPLGILNLEDNMWVQQGGFVLLVACIVAWIAQFGVSGIQLDRMPANNFSGWGSVISTVVFNFGYVTTLPSWLNERAPHVGIARTAWTAVIVSGVMFLILGFGGAYSLDFSTGSDLIAVLNDPATPHVMVVSQIASYVFPIAALLSGIPVFSIIIRYNLLQEGVHVIPANLFAVVFPWVVALAFFAGNSLNTLITWSSAILFVMLNFILPLWIYIVRRREMLAAPPAVSDESRSLIMSLNFDPDSHAGHHGHPGHAHLHDEYGNESYAHELGDDAADTLHELPHICNVWCGRPKPLVVAYWLTAVGVLIAIATLALQISSVVG